MQNFQTWTSYNCVTVQKSTHKELTLKIVWSEFVTRTKSVGQIIRIKGNAALINKISVPTFAFNPVTPIPSRTSRKYRGLLASILHALIEWWSFLASGLLFYRPRSFYFWNHNVANPNFRIWFSNRHYYTNSSTSECVVHVCGMCVCLHVCMWCRKGCEIQAS